MTRNNVPGHLDDLPSGDAVRSESNSHDFCDGLRTVESNLQGLKQPVLGEVCLIDVRERSECVVAFDGADCVLNHHQGCKKFVRVTLKLANLFNRETHLVAESQDLLSLR
jgi:hypothetical protein